MKTLEFKLNVNSTQASLIDVWGDQLRSVWNSGLQLLEESQQRRWREKHPGILPESLTLQWRKGRTIGGGIRKTRDGYKYCPVRQSRDVDDPKKLFNSGSYYNNTLAPYLADIPSKFRTGVHKSLQQAWRTYQDPKHPGRRPRFKGKRDVLRSLANYNAGGKSNELKPVAIAGTDNGYVHFPGLGKLHVKGFYARFDPTQPYGMARIVKEHSGFYLHVVATVEEKPLKPSVKAVGIDPGVVSFITDDSGRKAKPANHLRKQLKRLRRLQRHASRQRKGSNGQKRTHARVGRLHEKVRRSRNAFNHKVSTKLVREYGAIAFEGSNLQNMTRRPKAKLSENGKGYAPNNAKAKSGLNRALGDVAWGDLRSKIETKCKRNGREFVATKAQNSSRECCGCGEIGDRPTQSDFYCQNAACALHQVRQCADTNAARNHLLRSGFLETGKYRSLGWELKQGKKDVASRSADTLSQEEKRSRKGTPPEGTASPEAVPPCRELSAPILILGMECNDLEMYNFNSLTHEPQSLAALNIDADGMKDSLVTHSQALAPKDLDPNRKRRRKSKNLISGAEGKGVSRVGSATQLQLDFWGVAVEAIANT